MAVVRAPLRGEGGAGDADPRVRPRPGAGGARVRRRAGAGRGRARPGGAAGRGDAARPGRVAGRRRRRGRLSLAARGVRHRDEPRRRRQAACFNPQRRPGP